MMFEEAQREFAVRYYLWAREEACLEVACGYPTLRRIYNTTCRKHLRRMAQLSIEDQQAITMLLVKRFHTEAVELLGEPPLSSEEIAAINGFFDSFALERDPYDSDYYERLGHGDPTVKLDRRRFRKIIRTCLAAVFGKEDRGGRGAEWTYTTCVENLHVITHIDTGGTYRHLGYYHSIQFSEDVEYIQGFTFWKPQYLRQRISVLEWLGLSTATDWRHLEDFKAEGTAQLLAELCQRFMDAAPRLLEGLGP